MIRTIRTIVMRPVRALTLLLGLVALQPSPARADYDGQAVGQVAFLQVWNSGTGFSFMLVGTPNLCTAPLVPGNGYVETARGATPEGVKLLYATIFAAKLSGANIRVYANNSSYGCTVAAVDYLG